MTYTNVEYTAADIYDIKYKRKLDHFRTQKLRESE
jgi:hypothetical protein